MNKEVYKVSLGGIIVRLRNKANVCEVFLDEIFSKSNLDNRILSLNLDDKNDDICITESFRAYTTPSYPYGKNLFPSGGDTFVYVPKITTDKWKEFKPYFAFVLGHELEHVKVIRENLKFHLCATWLFDYDRFGNFFAQTGIDCKSVKKWNFPLELHCNKKGKKIATDLFGTEEFGKCLIAMTEDKNETKEHKEYLSFIMELEGEPYAENICKSICCDIRASYYYNNKLRKIAHEIWLKERAEMDKIAVQFDLEGFLPLD